MPLSFHDLTIRCESTQGIWSHKRSLNERSTRYPSPPVRWSQRGSQGEREEGGKGSSTQQRAKERRRGISHQECECSCTASSLARRQLKQQASNESRRGSGRSDNKIRLANRWIDLSLLACLAVRSQGTFSLFLLFLIHGSLLSLDSHLNPCMHLFVDVRIRSPTCFLLLLFPGALASADCKLP